MEGTPEDIVILHWNEARTSWERFAWRDWVRFRGFVEKRSSDLIGAEPGEHYFLICFLGERGELANVIPHKYVMSADGRLVYAFDGLEPAEREERSRLGELVTPTIEDSERYAELGDRGFAVNLPPLRTVPPLLKAMPGLAGARPSAPCWRFLAAIGVSASSTQPN
jgi:hypothetical protein